MRVCGATLGEGWSGAGCACEARSKVCRCCRPDIACSPRVAAVAWAGCVACICCVRLCAKNTGDDRSDELLRPRFQLSPWTKACELAGMYPRVSNGPLAWAASPIMPDCAGMVDDPCPGVGRGSEEDMLSPAVRRSRLRGPWPSSLKMAVLPLLRRVICSLFTQPAHEHPICPSLLGPHSIVYLSPNADSIVQLARHSGRIATA
jgi:hypothetical protein